MACGVTDGMTDTIVTSDLARFGGPELEHAIDMIRCYKDGIMGNVAYDVMTTNIRLQINTESRTVFLTDEDLHTFVLSDDHPKRILYVHWCADCGNEGAEGAYVPRPGCKLCITDKIELGI